VNPSPEKYAQIIGIDYQDYFKQLQNSVIVPPILKVQVLMSLSFWIYLDNILINVGVRGLQIFIEENCKRFKNYHNMGEDNLIHDYLQEWYKFGQKIVEDNPQSLLSPKATKLVETFLTNETNSIKDQMIIFVDQRIIADLLLMTLKAECHLFTWKNGKNKDKIKAIYSHSNRGPLKKLAKKLKNDNDKELELLNELMNLEVSQNLSLEKQKSILKQFKDGQINILIATSVIEEGLDIPSCNQIIWYDKIQTPKTFIQMAGRARKIDSIINFMCLENELKLIMKSKSLLLSIDVEIMQKYKDLLNENEILSQIKPEVSPASWTYPDDEMFIIKSTGARVSIDGSMDLINVVTQKLNTKHKVSKLKETFVHKETPNISFNCSIDLRIGKSEIKQYEDRYFSTKSKARAYSVLKLLENLYEKGFLDDYLNAHTEIFNTKKDSLTKRKKLEKEINTFKEENKGVMKVEGVEFKYIINHDRLNNLNEYSQSVKIIVFLPDKSNEYPFPPSEHSQCIGFLTDKDTLPKSENITLFTKKDQMDRIKHFQNNTQNNDFFSDESKYCEANHYSCWDEV